MAMGQFPDINRPIFNKTVMEDDAASPPLSVDKDTKPDKQKKTSPG